MLLLNEGIARSMVDYRTDRLAAARRRASAYGYRGVMFPWESDWFGEESTPTWAITGPMEHHITADVGIAAWNYYCVTRDREWLRTTGWPLLKEIAAFWVSRVVRNDDGSYSIAGVVGADEYAMNVTDNAFTNGAAKVVLCNAVEAARACGEKAPVLWSDIADEMCIRDSSSLSLVENEGLRIGRQRQRQQRRISRHTDLHDRRKVDRFGAGDCRDTSREDHRVARLSTCLLYTSRCV